MSSTGRKIGQQYPAIVSRAIEVERGTKDCAASRLVPESPIWQLVCLVKGSHTAKPGWGPVKTDGQRSQLSGVTVGRNSCSQYWFVSDLPQHCGMWQIWDNQETPSATVRERSPTSAS